MEKLALFILIFFLSAINNLLLPYIIYFKKYGFGGKKEKPVYGVNEWGIIMDGILAGFLNIIFLNFLLEIKPVIMITDIISALIIALIITFFTHIFMAVRKWQIWIMPTPWRWNSAGYWHIISMTLQMFFLFYVAVLVFNDLSLLGKTFTKISILISLFIIALFFRALYCFDNRIKFKIGKFTIGNKPW